VRRKLFLAAQVIVAVAVAWLAGDRIKAQWHDARTAGFGLEIDWGMLGASALLVLLAYGVLIEGWRVLINAWGARLPFAEASRIWFVSNLGRYIPGKVWQLGAMGVMAQRAGVSALAAAGAALLMNLLTLVSGVGVVALTGAGLLGRPLPAVLAAGAVAAAVMGAPHWLPAMVPLVERLTGRSVPPVTIPARAMWTAAVASVVSWLLYGAAFRLLAAGVAPSATGPVGSYVAVFTASYLIGYLVFFVPGGLVVRETALAGFLSQLQLATGGTGLAIAGASRLLLTVLELVPAALHLAVTAVRRRHVTPGRNERSP
jgi:uncharacterized membrane protein YbhN (UPF0104 family)